MYRSFIFGTVACAIGLASVVPVRADPLCHPKLTVTNAQFSEMIAPTLQRKWTAVVSVDASRCQANSTGYFDIVVTRFSETAPVSEFSKRFGWRPPSVEVAVNFAAKILLGVFA